MRTFLIFCFCIILSAAGSLASVSTSHAKSYKPKGFVPASKGVLGEVADNPGKSIGVAGCGVAIAFFPPAALACGALIVTGTAADELIE